MIRLISTPEHPEPLDPTIISRWVATESANNFRLQRRDYLIVSAASYGAGLLAITVAAGTYTGAAANIISVYNKTLDTIFVGEVQAGSTTTIIYTDLDYIAGFNPGDVELNPLNQDAYLNDNTEFGGYYFEGRLTVNGILESFTIIASPDSFGFADLDVSGVLRIHTALGKIGDYSAIIMKETTKSGKFSFEYRGCWYGSSESWIPEGGSVSPPSDEILWYYGECVRSEEQGSNLYEYVVNAMRDAPFLNSFDRPILFLGLPFDLSFILPELSEVSPVTELIVTMKIYNIANTQLGVDIITYVPADALEGFINSLKIDPASIPDTADHLTIEVAIP
jgi:hypothetical protein